MYVGGRVVGNGFVKGADENGLSVFPSIVAVEQAGIDFSGFKSSKDFVIEFEGQRLAVGDSARKLGRLLLNDMDRSRVETPYYKSLLAASLVNPPVKEGEISLVITLPLAQYMERDRVKKFLAGCYQIKRGNRTYTYDLPSKNIRIVPEGFGVLAAQLLDANGSVKDAGVAKATIAIIESGTKTTDFSFFERLELIPVKSAGRNVGLNDVWRSIAADVYKATSRELDLHEIDQAIQEGCFMDSGKVIDIKPYVKRHMPNLANVITAEANALWDGGRDADAIYVAGGGGPQIYHMLPYSHAKLADQAWGTDAIGAYWYGLYRSKSK